MRADRPFFLPLAITVVAAILAALLLVWAFVAWLAEIFGSFKTPCLLVGGFMAVVAVIVYKVALKSYFEELRVLYSVSRVVRGWMDWAAAFMGGVKEKEEDVD